MARRKNYLHRNIYKKYHGSIPVDSDGRTYDIHHIDCDHTNNDISNLIAVSIQDHFRIHQSLEDWDACLAIARRMNKSVEEISELSKKVQAERIKNNTFHFQKRPDGSSVTSDRTKKGLNPFSKREDGTSVASDKVRDGTHNFLNHDGTYKLDKTLYTFKNLNTGEIVTMSRKEFIDTYNMHSHQGNLSSMINGKTRVGKKKISPIAPHVKGWVIVRAETLKSDHIERE